MIGLRALARAVLAEHYRGRAKRLLTKVDQILARAASLRDRAAQLETDVSAPLAGPLLFDAAPWLCGLLLAALLMWLVHDAWK